MTADEIKTLLHLEPHPVEGGFYRRTYTSAVSVALLGGVRPYGTAIYYLLEEVNLQRDTCAGIGRDFPLLISAIRWRCCSFGRRGARGRCVTLDQILPAGQHVQHVVPAGVWQGTRLVNDGKTGAGKVALLGCTVTPGFDFADYRSG